MLGYGARVIFSTRRLGDLGVNSPRVLSYLRSYRRLQPHRRVLPEDLTRRQVLREPISHNTQVTNDAHPLRPTGSFGPLLTAGVTTVGDLSRESGCPQDVLAQVRGALPPAWLEALSAPVEPLVGDFLHPLHPGILLTSVVDEETAELQWTASRVQQDGRPS
jgi:hypothetical protein